SIIPGIDWDHADIYPTREEYYQAFRDFLAQSNQKVIWQSDIDRLNVTADDSYHILDESSPETSKFRLAGIVNRQNAYQVVAAVQQLTQKPFDELKDIINKFPGVSRRFERIAENVYSDYAHTPAKIRGALQLAVEVLQSHETRIMDSDEAQGSGEEQSKPYMQYDERVPDPVTPRFAESAGSVIDSVDMQDGATQRPGVVVVYEGLHNTRQHFIKDDLAHLFDDVKKLYVVPSYLAREDESLEMLTPEKLIAITAKPDKAEAKVLDEDLRQTIERHQKSGDLVLCLTAGGGNSLDEWLRRNFS
ncbi:MAG: hypothetical protein AAB459_02715, partial [Patescibacteria group bacterium]